VDARSDHAGHPANGAGAARQPAAAHAPAAAGDQGLRHAVRTALGDRSYLLLHAGFFTCGFHIAFLVTHLPGEVALCGLPSSVASWSLAIIGLANIAGSLIAGWWVNRFRSKYILFWMYLSRALLVLAYLAAPKTALTFYLFAVGLGFTWLATVPPTAGVVAKLFGTRYLATLFGLTLLSHQIGAFFGAYLGASRSPARELPVDVVRRRGAGAGGRAGEPADPRGAGAAPTGGCGDVALRRPGLRLRRGPQLLAQRFAGVRSLRGSGS